jgi:hypothetical protein
MLAEDWEVALAAWDLSLGDCFEGVDYTRPLSHFRVVDIKESSPAYGRFASVPELALGFGCASPSQSYRERKWSSHSIPLAKLDLVHAFNLSTTAVVFAVLLWLYALPLKTCANVAEPLCYTHVAECSKYHRSLRRND